MALWRTASSRFTDFRALTFFDEPWTDPWWERVKVWLQSTVCGDVAVHGEDLFTLD